MTNNFEELEKKIQVTFKDKNLLKEALTHRSFLNEQPSWPIPHNERLEFLGDAVLELAVTEALFKRFPNYAEGQLTVLRAALVNYQILAQVARSLGLDLFILMSKGEAKDTGKAREVILANAIEALIGAIYLDYDFGKVWEFSNKFILPNLEEIIKNKSYKDSKSTLQEIVQEKLRITPSYQVLDETGPAHQKIFRVGVYFGDNLIAEGTGTSKQEAEIEAAKKALESSESFEIKN